MTGIVRTRTKIMKLSNALCMNERSDKMSNRLLNLITYNLHNRHTITVLPMQFAFFYIIVALFFSVVFVLLNPNYGCWQTSYSLSQIKKKKKKEKNDRRKQDQEVNKLLVYVSIICFFFSPLLHSDCRISNRF